jgi:DNA-binding NarL/FixJ family response regulator
MIKILIADDHKMFVDGLESILQGEEDIKVVARCFNGDDIFKIIKEQPVDVILLDINLPGMNGIEVTKQMSQKHSKVKILALSMHNEESFVTEILRHGALGYILKNTDRKELLTAIRAVYNGQTYFSKDVTQTIMKSLVKKEKQKHSTNLLIPKISRREKEVLELIVKEFTTQEIASELFISLKTVESHRSSLLSKLNVRNTAGLVRMALEHKLIDSKIQGST